MARPRSGGILSRVRLQSADESSVEISIACYQFPDRRAQGDRDWDANWLQVAGTVVLADGRTWTFEDPCLTTRDATDLGQWLHDVAAGSVRPSPLGSDGPEEMKVFLEPNIAFSLQDRLADRVQLRVYLSLESLPPWLKGDAQIKIWDYFVVLDVPTAQLAREADDWTEDLRRFPAR